MCLCHFYFVSLRAGRIPGSLHCAAENGLALVCEVLFSDRRDFGLCYCTLSAAGETKHSAPAFLAWGLSGTSAKPFRKLLFSSLLYLFPASVYFNPPKLKQRVFLPSAPAFTVALIFYGASGDSRSFLLKYCSPSPPHQLAGSHISRGARGGQGACVWGGQYSLV